MRQARTIILNQLNLLHNVMHMSDYVEQLDLTIHSVGEDVLEGAGKISHKKAMEKAEGEYRKY